MNISVNILFYSFVVYVLVLGAQWSGIMVRMCTRFSHELKLEIRVKLMLSRISVPWRLISLGDMQSGSDGTMDTILEFILSNIYGKFVLNLKMSNYKLLFNFL